MMGKGGYDCGWSVGRTLVIEMRKKRRRKSRKDEFDFDDFS